MSIFVQEAAELDPLIRPSQGVRAMAEWSAMGDSVVSFRRVSDGGRRPRTMTAGVISMRI